MITKFTTIKKNIMSQYNQPNKNFNLASAV